MGGLVTKPPVVAGRTVRKLSVGPASTNTDQRRAGGNQGLVESVEEASTVGRLGAASSSVARRLASESSPAGGPVAAATSNPIAEGAECAERLLSVAVGSDPRPVLTSVASGRVGMEAAWADRRRLRLRALPLTATSLADE